MVKNPIIKETAWLSPEVQRLLGTGVLETLSKRHGLSISLKSERLGEVVHHLIKVHGVKRIVETGTFNGSGTTTTYAKTGLPVYSCEAHKRHYDEAKLRLAGNKNVHLTHAFSTQKSDVSTRYLEQLGDAYAPEQENWLSDALNASPPAEAILVSLDSAGDIGIKEAEVFTAWVDSLSSPKTIALILDDIFFQKHLTTIPLLETKYGVDVYQVDDRWGFTVIEVPGR